MFFLSRRQYILPLEIKILFQVLKEKKFSQGKWFWSQSVQSILKDILLYSIDYTTGGLYNIISIIL